MDYGTVYFIATIVAFIPSTWLFLKRNNPVEFIIFFMLILAFVMMGFVSLSGEYHA